MARPPKIAPKLTADAVLAIRSEREAAIRENRRPRYKQFCRLYGVTAQAVYDACLGRTFRWVL